MKSRNWDCCRDCFLTTISSRFDIILTQFFSLFIFVTTKDSLTHIFALFPSLSLLYYKTIEMTNLSRTSIENSDIILINSSQDHRNSHKTFNNSPTLWLVKKLLKHLNVNCSTMRCRELYWAAIPIHYNFYS